MIAIKNILVATDFSEPSDAALTYGRELARQFGATLHVLHAVENIYITTFGAENFANVAPDLQQRLEEEAGRHLQELVTPIPNGTPTIAALVTTTSPAFAIVDYAKAHDIDAIVMGTHGRSGWSHLFMGSVAERVVRLAPCPVLTVRHPEREFVQAEAAAAAAHV